MTAYCAACKRSFKGPGELDQHMQNSSAHKKSTQRPPKVQNLPQLGITPIKRKQLLQLSPPQVEPAGPSKSVDSSSYTRTMTQHEYGQLPNTIASSSYNSQVTKAAGNTVPQGVTSRWSVIPESEFAAALNALSAHCHSPRELEENGYVLRLYNALDYANSRKCKRCNGREAKCYSGECTFHLYKRNKQNSIKPYKCCTTDGRGCMTSPTHDFQLPLHITKRKDFLPTPAASAKKPKFRAVTLDCEMAGIVGGEGEVILLCAADYVTGAILLNRLVCPRGKIIQMRSFIHGISKSTLDNAVSQGQALIGWEEARSELWKFIDNSTILVGHSLEHDLDALRMIHPRIVDSGILSRSAVGIHRIRWGLKTLCTELLKFDIRENGDGVHDCLEDVLATREVVLFCTKNTEAFHSWAEAKKCEEIRLEKEREIARQEKEKGRARKDEMMVGSGLKDSGSTDSSDDDEGVILHWSDIAEDLGWPHSDTGYDPWSD